MIPRLLLLVLILIAPGAAAEPLRVLFIGNSLTFTNDLPGMLAALAKAGGQGELVHASETPGGCSFKKQWEGGKALAKIQGRTWDYVVLQGHSDEPITAPQDMAAYGARLSEAVAKQGAKTAWYMTWAHRGEQDKQPAITKAYTDLSAANGGVLIPAGVVWDAYCRAHPEQDLYKDIKHPKPPGTYLVACVFYAVLYHANPIGLPGDPAHLDADQARAFQEAAWAAVGGAKPAVK
jgi:hypothetical protein